MSLLLRISIVFVALVYLGQLRRKNQHVHNANSFWLMPDTFLHHPGLRSQLATNQHTAQIIQEFFENHASNGRTLGPLSVASLGGRAGPKTEEDLLREYQDMPPNYEEALQYPIADNCKLDKSASPKAHSAVQGTAGLHSRCSSQSTLTSPPSFEQITSSAANVNTLSPSSSVSSFAVVTTDQASSSRPSS